MPIIGIYILAAAVAMADNFALGRATLSAGVAIFFQS
jgi:hypothetical protein